MNARTLMLVAGAVLLIVGVIGLLVPVSASSNGESVGCGNAIMKDTSEAEKKDKNLGNTAADVATDLGVPQVSEAIPQTHFVAACDSAVSGRRAWSIPVAVVGLIVAGGAFLVRGGRSPAT